ncbi:MAG: hypothetical protein DRJ09_02355 [Bacteroidetes bacterium]|nr:MAG: hypothetical protein DRJ09_02355 [Bacteroidota bacterium]
MRYYILNAELKDTCEFNPDLFTNTPSIYEVIRIEDGIPLFLQDHIERFYHSMVLSENLCNITEKQIRSRLKALIETNRVQTGLLKFVSINHPEAGKLFAAWIAPFFFPSAKDYELGITMMSYRGIRENPNAKTSHQKIREKSNRLIKYNSVHEVMLFNEQGIISEGSRSNLFFINGGILFTPHHSLVLKGVTRQKIIDLALASGIDVVESAFRRNEISDFEALFITGTTPKVLPVYNIDTVPFKVSHPVIQYLSEKYNNLIAKYVKNFSW